MPPFFSFSISLLDNSLDFQNQSDPLLYLMGIAIWLVEHLQLQLTLKSVYQSKYQDQLID